METLITLKRKLEEKEKILISTIGNLEKEVDLKQKSMETYKRKVIIIFILLKNYYNY